MAKSRSGQDMFTNYAALTVVESAANTLTFQQLATGGNLFERRALVLNRASYYTEDQNNVSEAADFINFGLSTNNQMASVAITDPNVIDFHKLSTINFGTAGNAQVDHQPYLSDFSNMPGGGLIVPAYPIYLWVKGASLAGAVTINCKLFFTVMELSAEQYIELVEATRILL